MGYYLLFIEIARSAMSYFGFTAFLFLVSKYLWRKHILKSAEDPNSELSKTLPLPPGEFGIPFLGETISWALEGGEFNSSRRKKHGKIFSTHFLGKPLIKVTGASNVKQILQGEHDKVTTVWPTTVRRILGEHSITHSPEDKHKYLRKLAFKGFSQSSLNGYIPQLQDIISRKMKVWGSHCGPRKIFGDIQRMTFDASVKSMTGYEFDSMEDQEQYFKIFDEMIANLFSIPYDVPCSGFRKGLKNSSALRNLLDNHLRKKLKQTISDPESEEANDAVHHIMIGDVLASRKRESKDSGIESDKSSNEDEERRLTMEELKQIAIELMFAGYATTNSSISSTIIQLAKHPEVKDRVENELEEHGFLEEDCTDITLERIQKLSYLEQVVKETMRMMPPILGGYRKALKTFQLGDYRIPKGWTVVYNIRDTHEYEFQDDMEFNPDRFSREAWSENRENRFRWLPFGGGPRMCVGKEYARLIIKLTIIEMIRAFKSWKFENDESPPMFAVPTLHPTNGLPIIFTTR